MKHNLFRNPKPWLFGLALLVWAAPGHANDIAVSNGTLVANNSSEARVNVRFDLSWQNSWRTSSAPNNWDAAWVFVKYQLADGTWHHARLGAEADHLPGSGTPATVANGLLVPDDPYDAATNWGVGAFVYRSGDGTGTFSATGVELRWNYGQNGIAYTDIANVQVFAIEMVWVPEGAFYLGTGGSEYFHFKDGTTNNPFPITSEAAVNMANSTGSLWAVDGTYIETATLPAAFPKGYKGFYMMKHGVAQVQYVNFLNTLTRDQQNTRTTTNLAPGVTSVTNRYVMCNSASSSYRQYIRCDAVIDATAPITFYCDANGNGTGNEANDGQWVACNYLSWADGAAYLDWSGLRPMTELEYEKASNAGANVNYDGSLSPQGPIRVGAFATAGATRVQAGAGYYGALDLSGNLWERPVTVGNAPGRAFEGTVGNGALDATGNADAASWPGTNALGAGFRGGLWYDVAADVRLSDRPGAAATTAVRGNYGGARGVR